MPPRVSTADRDAVLRQIRWCAAVQTLANCHCKLEEDPVRHVEPVQLVVQLAECAPSMAEYSQQATTCRTQSLTTGDVRDWNSAVYKILRLTVVETSTATPSLYRTVPVCQIKPVQVGM